MQPFLTAFVNYCGFYKLSWVNCDVIAYNKEIVNDLIKNLEEEQFQSICINDTPYCSEENFIYSSGKNKKSL